MRLEEIHEMFCEAAEMLKTGQPIYITEESAKALDVWENVLLTLFDQVLDWSMEFTDLYTISMKLLIPDPDDGYEE